MKKLRKSLSFTTKVMLAFGLLISNLSSLSFVFAAEVKTEITVVDDKLNIKYLDELADDVKSVKVNVYENFTYLDESYYVDEETSLKGKVSSYELTFNEDLSDDSLVEEETEDNVTDVETPSDEISVEENVEESTDNEVVEEETNSNEEVIDEETNLESEETTLESVETEEINVENEEENSELEVVTDELVEEIEDTTEEEIVEKEIDLEVESILSSIVFDGTYDVTVEIIDTTDLENPEVIDTQDYSMAVLHDAGLKISVIDEVSGLEVKVLDDLRYAVSSESPKVLVVASLLAGGLSPRDQILYNNQEYFAYELMDYGFSTEVDFSGKLYGDYKLPVEFELSKFNRETQEYEKVEFTEEELTANILYGEYQLNTDSLNETVMELELDDSYQFDGNSKNGVVYVLLDDSKTYTMWDLYSVLNDLYGDSELISFVLSNSLYEDVLTSYDSENATISLEEHLKEMVLDENVVLSISNKGLDITYKLVFAGDLNNDKKLTNEDLVDLINQIVGEKEVDADKADIYNDDEVNTLDAIVLDQIIKNNSFDVEITEDLDKVIDASLEVVETDIVSGDKFTVNYIVKLSDLAINGVSGLFTYDKDALELEKVEVVENWLGNSKDGKFLYVGEKSLELPEIEEPEEEVTQPEDSEDVIENENTDAIITDEENSNLEELEEEMEVITNDYVVVSATFVAKKAGTHTINVEDIEYFNQNVYYGVSEETVSTTVVVNKSDDNTLASLVVAGVEIVLEEDKLEYEITVGSDVTTADVVAILNNVAANITSIVSPEELAEGENVITVTVTAENGDVKVYTIKVIREEMPEEETTTTQVNYGNNYEENEDDNEEDVVVTEPEEDDNEDDDDDKNDKEEESNLSRIVIIILILLVIAGLIYLIFKDEDEDDTKKINKDVNKLRKEEKVIEVKKEEKVNNKSNNKPNNKVNNSNKNKNYKNNKKER